MVIRNRGNASGSAHTAESLAAELERIAVSAGEDRELLEAAAAMLRTIPRKRPPGNPRQRKNAWLLSKAYAERISEGLGFDDACQMAANDVGATPEQVRKALTIQRKLLGSLPAVGTPTEQLQAAINGELAELMRRDNALAPKGPRGRPKKK